MRANRACKSSIAKRQIGILHGRDTRRFWAAESRAANSTSMSSTEGTDMSATTKKIVVSIDDSQRRAGGPWVDLQT